MVRMVDVGGTRHNLGHSLDVASWRRTQLSYYRRYLVFLVHDIVWTRGLVVVHAAF
jgi:hypothetical protein